MKSLVTFLLFQAVWFGSIWGAAIGALWFGPLLSFLFIAIVLTFFSDKPMFQAVFAAAALILGLIMDAVTGVADAFTYPQLSWNGPWAAPFMLALWPAFAVMMPICIKWIRGRLAEAAVFGAIGGPLAYWAGHSLGAIHIVSPVWGISMIALEWSLAMVFLLWIWEIVEPLFIASTQPEVLTHYMSDCRLSTQPGSTNTNLAESRRTGSEPVSSTEVM